MFTSFKSKKRSGSVLVMTALAGVFLLAVTALVTDVGFLYLQQSRLQTAVNAAWKAGFDRMMKVKGSGVPVLSDSDKAAITKHVIDVIESNGYSKQEIASASLQVIFGNNNQLTVTAKQSVGLFFVKVLNIDSSDVSADRGGGELAAIIPLGIPHGATKDVSPTKYRCKLFGSNEEFTVGREYIIKLGDDKIPRPGDAPWGILPKDTGDQVDFGYATGSDYTIKYGAGGEEGAYVGNFGALDLDSAFDGSHGGGASGNEYIEPNNGKTYADNYEGWIKYGLNPFRYPGGLTIGSVLWTETGNMAGPTRRGVEYRIANNLLDIRIPVLPSFPKGQSNMVEIIGFLNFRLILVEGSGNGATVKATYMGADYGVDRASGTLKISYGRIDPNNIETDASQYLDNFKYGYSAPVELGQMILPENGNATESTAAAVAYRLSANPTESPKTVIVPITEIPPEIGKHNPKNATATTIYDLYAEDSPDGAVASSAYTFGSSVRITGFAEFDLLSVPDYTRVGENFIDGGNGDAGDLGLVRPGQVRGIFKRYIIKPGTI